MTNAISLSLDVSLQEGITRREKWEEEKLGLGFLPI
jgi:hypothetical protein